MQSRSPSPLVGQKRRYLRTFLIALGTAAVIFLPFVLIDKGYFIYYGDFNVQQIPFYQMTHDAIREGNIFWSPTTDLGANFIGSYSFYNLGSPFFWLTLPFPSEVVPYLMAPLLVLKTAVAATTAYAYIARFVRNNDYAVLGGLLYAFSGFTTYNIFFNHFHEPIAFFPLLLIGLEEYMQNDRRGVFALSVLLNCFVNYFFFAGQVVFVVIYWFLRLPSKDWKLTFRKFLGLALEAVLGVAMSAVLLIPAVLVAMSNPRTGQYFTSMSALVYGWPQRYGHILESFFFPPDIPARPNFFPSSEAKWASVAAWLPVFSMCGVFTFMSANRGHWLKRILCTLFIMAFVPIFNSAFFLFNSSYYARWFYMLILMMALATVKALEDNVKMFKSGIRITAGVTIAIVLLVGLLPKKNDAGEITLGLMEYPDRFWVYSAIAVICLILTWTIVTAFRRDPKKLLRVSTVCVVFVSVIYSIYMMSLGKISLSESRDFIIPYSLNGGEDITLERADNYRIDVLNGDNLGLDNQAMFWQMPTIQAFHSVVPASIMEFYPSVGVTRDVGSRPEKKFFDLRCFLSAKYLFNRQQMTEEDSLWENYDYIGWENGYYIYENKYYIPMGFTYDRYVTRSEFNELVSDYSKQRMLLRALVIEDEDAEKYADVLQKYDADADRMLMGTEGLETYSAERSAESCDTFEYDNRGFSATISLEKENLVFFTVPWEEGWTAQVNGEPAEIVKTNIGFMSVLCPAGEKVEIRFDYMTPGLKLGLCVTGGAVLVFIVYLLLAWAFARRRRRVEALVASAQNEDYLADIPVSGEKNNGIEYDYYLEGVSITLSPEDDVQEIDAAEAPAMGQEPAAETEPETAPAQDGEVPAEQEAGAQADAPKGEEN